MIELIDGDLCQWDTGRKVRVSFDSKPVSEVHFSRVVDDNAFVVQPYKENGNIVANIPNILLQSKWDICVYIVSVAEDSERTVERRTFAVTPRKKPSDYIYTETEVLDFKDLEERIKTLEAGGASPDVIDKAVKEYLAENPIEASVAKIGTVTLAATKWVGGNNLYSQVVEVEGVNEKCQVDLTPSVEQLVVFYEKDLTFVTENENGVVTVYAIGQKPENDYTIQVTITEVQ